MIPQELYVWYIYFMTNEQISSIEDEPKHNVVIVDLLRHGATKYQENFTSHEEKKAMNGKYPKDLTPEGEEEVRKTAKEILKKIDPEKDVVVLWSSPAWRAQGSEKIIREILKENNIEVYKDSSVKSMRNFDQRDKEFMNNLWEELAPTNKSAEIMYAKDPKFQEKNDRFESQPEVKKRAERVFNQIRRLAENTDLNNKRLHIIGVSHFEFINPLIEDIFGSDVEKGQGIKKGEDINITFDYDKSSKNMSISADFRGEHKGNIIFNEDRKFSVEK